MTELVVQASWILIATFTISILYEIYRVVFKGNISKWDTKRSFFTLGIPMYLLYFTVAILVRTGWPWVVWLTLILTLVAIAISIFYYNPVMMVSRKPGLIDWVEDMIYTGLLFVAAALLIYHVRGITLVSY